MTHPSVLTTELTGYRATAAELRRVADAIEDLPGEQPYLAMNLIPAKPTAEAVDAVALAVMGERGETTKCSGGWKRHADMTLPGSHGFVTVHTPVPGPADGGAQS